jgi:hypothetical protein
MERISHAVHSVAVGANTMQAETTRVVELSVCEIPRDFQTTAPERERANGRGIERWDLLSEREVETLSRVVENERDVKHYCHRHSHYCPLFPPRSSLLLFFLSSSSLYTSCDTMCGKRGITAVCVREREGERARGGAQKKTE